jgi:hypothetical protein
MVVREAAAILNRVCSSSATDSGQQQQQPPQQQRSGLFRRNPSLGRKQPSSPHPAPPGGSVPGSSTRSSGNGALEGPQMLPLPSSSTGPTLPLSSSAVDDSDLGVSRNVHDAGLLVLPSLSSERARWAARLLCLPVPPLPLRCAALSCAAEALPAEAPAGCTAASRACWDCAWVG